MTNVGVLGHALALFIFWPENLTLIPHLPCSVEAMNELKRKKQDLDKEVSRMSKELRKLRRRVCTDGKFQLREPQRTTARALMVMREGEPTAAMDFFRSKRKGATLDAAQCAEVETDLKEWWTHAGNSEKDSHRIMDDTNQKMHSAIKQAQRFLVDVDLEAWVEDQNVSKGINPVPAIVLQEANIIKQRIGVDVPGKHLSARQWMQRWRGRCGMKLRKFPAIEPLDEELMRGKASTRRNTKPYSMDLHFLKH